MYTSKIISQTIPALSPNDLGSQALKWMDVFRVSHLPIVEDKKLIGVIDEKEIFDSSDFDKPVRDYKLMQYLPYINGDGHFLDALRIIISNSLSSLPVIDENGEYLGIVTLETIKEFLSSVSSFIEEGSIVVLEIPKSGYSLTEIAGIIESNELQALMIYTTYNDATSTSEIVIKLNKTDLTSLIKSFERYNYIVLNTFNASNNDDEMLENRYNELLNYLNV